MHHICCKMDDGASHLHVSIKADLSRTRQVELYIQHQISLNAMLSSKIPLSDAKVNHLQNKPLRSAQTLALAGRRGERGLLARAERRRDATPEGGAGRARGVRGAAPGGEVGS